MLGGQGTAGPVAGHQERCLGETQQLKITTLGSILSPWCSSGTDQPKGNPFPQTIVR